MPKSISLMSGGRGAASFPRLSYKVMVTDTCGSSFYEWRDPWQTTTTLFSLALVFLAISFTPAWLLIKGSQFFAGIVFFGLFPVSSRFPRYRLLISPTTWTFWGIPTHGKCSILQPILLSDVSLWLILRCLILSRMGYCKN